jgi:Zn-finger nucleic acid-binding protein
MPPPAFHSTAQCPFCNATVAPAADVEVVERVVQRVVLVDPGTPGISSMRCPRCAGECREGRVKNAILHGCTRCAGLWVDNPTVGTLSARTDDEVQDLARDLTRVIAMPMPHEQRVAELACPVCQVRMRRIPIKDTMYSVDVCSDHGTWFDRGEMEMFVKSFAQDRVGEITEDDLKAAGLPGAETKPGGGGFFSSVFQCLGSLVR